MCLSWTMIGVLSDYYSFDILKRTDIECIEDQTTGRVDCFEPVFFFNKFSKPEKVFFFKFSVKFCLPCRFNPHIHISLYFILVTWQGRTLILSRFTLCYFLLYFVTLCGLMIYLLPLRYTKVITK